VLDTPKSDGSRETIPVPGYLLARLAGHREAQAAARRDLGPDWEGWAHDCGRRPRPREVVCPSCRKPLDRGALVFAQPNGRPIRDRLDWGEWTGLLEELGIPHYRVHDGRHFAATLLLEQGVDISVVQAILRHADIRTTKIYTHVSVELGRAALERSAAALWGEDAHREAALRAETAGLDDELAKLLGGAQGGG
jgi:integrase